jgi:diguanylate cyclase (GGDEF)-like protein/PAS domain S-box-containing protein
VTGASIALTGTYDLRLLAVSIVLALLAPCLGFEVIERARATKDRARAIWIIVGGSITGVGLSCALDTGVASLQLPVHVQYHFPTLALTLALGIFCGIGGVFAITSEYKGVARALAASFLIGGGGVAISYVCLRSFRMPAVVEYRWDRIAILISFAVIAFLLVVVVDAGFLRPQPQSAVRLLISSLMIGAAVTALPVMTLRTVRFYETAPGTEPTFASSYSLFAWLAGIAFLLLCGAILSVTLDRALSSRVDVIEKARERESFFNNMAEAIPGIVWIADANGRTTYINRHWYELTGAPITESIGTGWIETVHPDDRAPCHEKFQACLRSGETFEIEYRLHDAVKGYRWYLDRAVPLRDDKGVIRQWFGTCTDIEEQKLYQQNLELQIKERTEELADANTRLQQEMWEKDFARRTLDEQNEKMMNALKERSQRATQLAQMGELLQSCITREEVFAAALGFAPRIFPTRRGAIALFNSARSLVEVAGQWHDCQLPLKAFEAESCWALRTGHPHLVLAGDTTARCGHALGITDTYFCVPVLAQGEPLGILHIQATDVDPTLGEADLSFKTTFASQIGLSVANIRLRDALRAQSIKDPLTGLFNRRYLQEMLDRELRRAIRSEQHLGILMLDLDHFKKFNDTYGHEGGDAVLRETASLLVRSIRAEDFVCRFGGEEFVVVLPTADLRASEARAQRIRSKLRDLVVIHDGRSLGAITVSIGVSALPNHGTTEKDLLQCADAALYRAKREGRDRVVVADDLISADAQTAASASPASKS